uniref:Immunoglobulin domain-containing protein n=1 Tax=Astyanax mexicanus TaxID=7994 RepID=A0A3B1J6M0_ASTMX
MEMKLQLIFTLSTLISITGSSDPVFRVVGDSFRLEINGSASEFDDFFWVFNSTVNVQKYYKILKHNTQTPRYKDRVEFNEETCSLTLKNVQKDDSGLYEVKASSTEKTAVAKYRLSVFDPVEAPVLSLTESTDTCNITLTCRGHDLSVSSRCSYRTCEEKEVTSPGGVALSLYVRDSVIICNHSNPASWKQKSVEMKACRHFCADTGTHTDLLIICLYP